MGSVLSAMLLGHYYLTAPAMSIGPLERFVRSTGICLALRAGLSAWGLAMVIVVVSSRGVRWAGPGMLFLVMRWGMGLLGGGLATWLAWQTVKIRSTQSATGILYIATTLIFIGELSAAILARDLSVGAV
jgi:hypothetical protein